jgi:hypothetical protein
MRLSLDTSSIQCVRLSKETASKPVTIEQPEDLKINALAVLPWQLLKDLSFFEQIYLTK